MSDFAIIIQHLPRSNCGGADGNSPSLSAVFIDIENPAAILDAALGEIFLQLVDLVVPGAVDVPGRKARFDQRGHDFF